ncbi:MAG TPA: hypothetical protein PKJ04_09065 [Nitrospira sp.]|nr:hypothetical protein [Nitrospira sp.]MBX3337272.1 hypothetical protein [Nitrospira sp.]MCW5781590.1 hypothetical protein [Nitrospira sp.]HNN42333.1 hypothetical protein [Nitrospira sp.]HNO35429.1 hypothetical protein [Nitrospira sp.]
MSRTNRQLVMVVEACVLAAGLLLCAADHHAARETILQANPREDLEQLFLLLKEETMLGQLPLP